MPTCRSTTHVLAVENAARTISLGTCDDEEWVPPSELVYHSFFAYLTFDDPHAYFEQVSDEGAEITGEPRRVDGRVVEFSIRTIDGHGIMCGK